MKKQLLKDCEKFWSSSASKLYRIAKTSIEHTSDDIYVKDTDGKVFIDCACSYGVFIVGHNHPKIKADIQKQISNLAWGNLGFTHEPKIKLTEKLKTMVPGSWLEISYFVSGAEAIEQSLRYILKLQTHKSNIIVMYDSYHGKTLTAMNILGQKQHDFGKLSDKVIFIKYGDIEALKEALGESGAKALYIEPILGGAHLTLPPKGYLKQVENLCKNTGTLLVADEIQTAFGRCGEMFAINYENIKPDILILSKGLTGGYASFACTLYSKKVIDLLSLENFEYDRTENGGHPFSCTAALSAINVIETENLVEKSSNLGKYFGEGLNKIALKYPEIVKDAPAIGLMTGLRLNGSVFEALLTMHLSKRGIHAGNSMNEKATNPVLRFYPPLTISRETLDFILNEIDASLDDISKMPSYFVKVMQKVVTNMYKIPNSILRA